MMDLSTTYCGIALRNPLVVGASSISSHLDKIQAAEEAGAAALVIRSLFEEQVQIDSLKMSERLAAGSESYAEASSYFPTSRHGGPKEHLMWIERARKAVKMPLFASLNAVTPSVWVTYAKQLADTGINGLELNPYSVATEAAQVGADIEQALYAVVEQVRAAVALPITVKLSPFYTSVANVVSELEKRGVQGVVLFNRFLQPDIDPDTESLNNEMSYSTPADIKLPLRWVALLHGRTQLDLALSTGVHRPQDAVKALLAGANTVQMAAVLLKNGVYFLSTLLTGIEHWMGEHNYSTLKDFQGKLSQKNCDDPFAFERAQYVNLLLDQR